MRSADPLSSAPRTTQPRSLQFESLEDRSLLAAQILTFDIDAARSFLALSGSMSASGSTFAFQSQSGGNSLVAAFDGSIQALLTESTIQFLHGSVLDALELRNSNGSLRLFEPPPPNSSNASAADYAAIIDAGIVSAEAALRGFTLDVASSTLVIGAGGNFSSAMVYTVDAGRMDFSLLGFRFAGDLAGKSASNVAAGTSRLQFGAGTIELTIPINILITQTTDVGELGTFDTSMRFTGQIVANVSFVDEGEPNDSPANALPIAPIQTIQGSLAGAADVDYFSMQLVAPGKLTVRASSGIGTTNPHVELFDASGALIATAPLGTFVNRNLGAGIYYLRLSAEPSLTGVSDYLLQTNFVLSTIPGSPGDGTVDPGDFVSINLTDLLDFQVGTFLFVKDLAASFQNSLQSSAPMLLPFLLRFNVDPSMLPQVGNLLPVAGSPGRAIYAPASPLAPLSFFTLERATGSGLSQLPTFAPLSGGVEARLAAAIARFGGGERARLTSDSTEPAAPVNVLETSRPRTQGNQESIPVIVPGAFGDVIDDLLQQAIQKALNATESTKPSDGDQSSSGAVSPTDLYFETLSPEAMVVEPEVCAAIAASAVADASEPEGTTAPAVAPASAGFLAVTATVFTDRIRRRRNRRGR